MAFCTHPRIGQNLCDCILCRRTLLDRVGLREVADVVRRVVIADELERIGHRLDEVVLVNRGGRVWRVWRVWRDGHCRHGWHQCSRFSGRWEAVT